jgi:hypothetical protein
MVHNEHRYRQLILCFSRFGDFFTTTFPQISQIVENVIMLSLKSMVLRHRWMGDTNLFPSSFDDFLWSSNDKNSRIPRH